LCPGNFITLDAQNPGATYLWSTGATTQTISVSAAGTYWVSVLAGSCGRSDTMAVTVAAPVSLGPDVDMCDMTSITLDAGNAGASFSWSTGATTQTIEVSDPSTYWVTVSAGNCLLTDSINVTGNPGGSLNIYVPNSFTPNGNGLNEVFMAKGEVMTFNMKIFDRWGALIFESSDINKGWDGFYKGRLVQEDVYVWLIEYSTNCTVGGPKRKIGHVSVQK
jgi:gliding motility-associated-like protein